MPSFLISRNRTLSQDPKLNDDLEETKSSHVNLSTQAEDDITNLHFTLTNRSLKSQGYGVDLAFADFENYLAEDDSSVSQPSNLSLCFDSVTTYGRAGGVTKVKTLKDAICRTFTLQDIYEATLKRLVAPERVECGQALIHDFSGVVQTGEIMLVLGNPGSGCSTFLKTIGNDHSSFLGVKGLITYSGLSPEEVSKHHRGSVTYVPEDDIHLPTLTVQETLEFALKNKTPKKFLHEIPRFLEQFGKVFGMTYIFDTLVGNEYIRGISGGERKRVSILESLASNSSVSAWDGSTRGLDATSALDYVRSLRIMTDACRRATIISIYQASDAIYDLVDKVMLIDEGRMLYQGPARDAERYFVALGYKRLKRQTMSDFLTGIASRNAQNIATGYEHSVPRGAVNLEKAFRRSTAYREVQAEVQQYKIEHSGIKTSSCSELDKQPKSRFVSSKSSYNTSFPRQVSLCVTRELRLLKGHKTPLITKLLCVLVSAFLIGSMFYNMSGDTGGVYSRGGFCFYSAALVAWFQLGELETAFHDRTVVSRQRRYAMVRPGAVVVAKTVVDLATVSTQALVYAIPAYFLSGMRREAGPFVGFTFAVFLAALSFTAVFRVFGAASRRLEIALRYCGLFLLIAFICGGYVRPVNQMLSDTPWAGWLAYVTPVLYSYEIIMVLEFHGRDFPCAIESLIPAGEAYTNTAFRSCAYQGIESGQLDLNGDNYLRKEFGFRFDHVGRNFAVLLLFLISMLLINIWIVEHVDWADGSGGNVEQVQDGSKGRKLRMSDEESTDQHSPAYVESSDTISDTSRPVSEDRKAPTSIFSWRNLNYFVGHGEKQKQLLKDVTGYCESGSLMALVGVSGAGKSTLMSVLTQQSTGTLNGEMRVNNKSIGPSFGSDVGYCQQMDIHTETSTIREAFQFSALLRQGAAYTKKQKLQYVDDIIGTLGLTEMQNVIIRSLSLEQKKRTTIGVELCARPSLLLFLDEPTSGLDSQGALSIVKLLRRLADAGQAIICTIHQASQEQFDIFDRVLAINEGGVYYFGDIGPDGATVLDYLRQQNIAIPAEKSVPDLLIDITARNQHADLCEAWNRSEQAAAASARIASISSTDLPDHSTGLTKSKNRGSRKKATYASSTAKQVVLLSHRTLIQYWRTPDYVYSRLYCSIFHATLNGLVFLQVTNSVASLQYRIFSCFMVLMIVPEFISASAAMFNENRNIWLEREYPSQTYGWFAFSTAQVIAEIPYALTGGVIFYILFYFLVGLPLGTPAGYVFLMMCMFHLFSTSWGQWIAALSADAVMAANLMPFFIISCEFFNGVLQPHSLMPAVWAYTMYYIAPFTYWISGIVAMILPGLAVRCLDSELTRFQSPPEQTCAEYAADWLSTSKGYLSNPNATSDCGYCQYSTGDDYLSRINVSSSDAWPYLGIFALFTISNYCLVYVCVYVKSVKNWLPW